MLKYFAYGSNMNSNRMKERDVNYSFLQSAILKGWKLLFNKIAACNPKEGYANIETDENSFVGGVLYEVNELGIKKLDNYEGYPDNYCKISVKVQIKKGKEVEAMAYIANPKKIRDGLKPSKEYLSHLLKGLEFLSAEYLKKLQEIETLD